MSTVTQIKPKLPTLPPGFEDAIGEQQHRLCAAIDVLRCVGSALQSSVDGSNGFTDDLDPINAVESVVAMFVKIHDDLDAGLIAESALEHVAAREAEGATKQ